MSPSRTLCLALAVASASCANLAYKRTEVGKIEGKLEVRWIEPNRFVYLPDKDDPLRFTTSDSRVITVGAMYTDGGSIPRLFWGVPGYSPWGYAPAYMVHDWLFEAHHCAIQEYQPVTFEDSARILGEALKTMMETSLAPKDETTMWVIREAVASPIARTLWDKPDSCNPPLDVYVLNPKAAGRLLMEISIPSRKPPQQGRSLR